MNWNTTWVSSATSEIRKWVIFAPLESRVFGECCLMTIPIILHFWFTHSRSCSAKILQAQLELLFLGRSGRLWPTRLCAKEVLSLETWSFHEEMKKCGIFVWHLQLSKIQPWLRSVKNGFSSVWVSGKRTQRLRYLHITTLVPSPEPGFILSTLAFWLLPGAALGTHLLGMSSKLKIIPGVVLGRRHTKNVIISFF